MSYGGLAIWWLKSSFLLSLTVLVQGLGATDCLARLFVLSKYSIAGIAICIMPVVVLAYTTRQTNCKMQ